MRILLLHVYTMSYAVEIGQQSVRLCQLRLFQTVHGRCVVYVDQYLYVSYGACFQFRSHYSDELCSK